MGQEEAVTQWTSGENLDEALHDVPVFPLPQVVLFPRALLPLHIFEPRYRAMLKDCVAGAGLLVMALLEDGPEDAAGQPPMARIAGLGSIVERHTLPDGRSNVVLLGRGRVRIEELPFVAPYRRARATVLREDTSGVTQADRLSLVHAATAFVGEIQRRDPKFAFHLPPQAEPGTMADLCAHHLILDPLRRQAILEELRVAERVRLVLAELMTQQATLGRADKAQAN
jgi:ATP-dependent Lon protease